METIIQQIQTYCNNIAGKFPNDINYITVDSNTDEDSPYCGVVGVSISIKANAKEDAFFADSYIDNFLKQTFGARLSFTGEDEDFETYKTYQYKIIWH